MHEKLYYYHSNMDRKQKIFGFDCLFEREGGRMLYLNNEDFSKISISWNETIGVIERALFCISKGDYSQPLKPYLRFKKDENRIIAMPAYVGGDIEAAGIKWIASFPKNIEKNIPRASSVTVLNDTNTGEVLAAFNSPMISIIRTASVSGYLIKKYLEFCDSNRFAIGIIGGGPIGQHHIKMCKEIMNNKITKIYFYDRKKIDIPDGEISVCDSWQEVYEKADIFITCTSSQTRYIDIPINKRKLILDISLRDFKKEAMKSFSRPFIVDDWEEVNRENTDIEYFAKIGDIRKENSITLCDIINSNLSVYYNEKDTIFFAPMGMGVFDVSIADYYYKFAQNNNIGVVLQ